MDIIERWVEKWVKPAVERFGTLRIQCVILLVAVALVVTGLAMGNPDVRWPLWTFIWFAGLFLAAEFAYITFMESPTVEPGTLPIVGLVAGLGSLVVIQRVVLGLSAKIERFMEAQKAVLASDETRGTVAALKDRLAANTAEMTALREAADVMRNHFDMLLMGIGLGLIMAFFIALVVWGKRVVIPPKP
jgi:hypothetical protein